MPRAGAPYAEGAGETAIHVFVNLSLSQTVKPARPSGAGKPLGALAADTAQARGPIERGVRGTERHPRLGLRGR